MAVANPYSSGGTPTQVGSPSVGTPSTNPQQLQAVPFRIATLERADLVTVDTQNQTTSEQIIERVLPGTGFVFGIDLDYFATTSGNGNAVTYLEDAPYSAASSVIFRDVDGVVVDADGFSLKQTSRYGGWERNNQESSTDTLIFNKVTGGGGTGGSYRFHLKIPIALNRRTLLGLLGNQDRGQSYLVRGNLGASTLVYNQAPTSQPSVIINRHYESYAVPNAANDQGQPQQVVPPFYGVISYITKSVSPNPPVGGQATNHVLQRINTTFRLLLLILRSNSSRATAESNLPTLVRFMLGNQPVFSELPAYRREKMFDRYQFDAPSGLLAYDLIHDFDGLAGAELGTDWYWTQQLAEAQFVNTYPSGFGSTANSLTIMTADMTVPAGMNVYAS